MLPVSGVGPGVDAQIATSIANMRHLTRVGHAPATACAQTVAATQEIGSVQFQGWAQASVAVQAYGVMISVGLDANRINR
jgi:hypothetical protein